MAEQAQAAPAGAGVQAPTQQDQLVTVTPLTLHPSNWSKIDADFSGDGTVAVLREAHSVANAAFRATYTGHHKIMADPMATPDHNLARSAKMAAKHQDEALRGLDAAVARAKSEIGMIDEAMNRPVSPPAPHVTTMIAARMSAMSAEERAKVLADAMRDSDEATLGSALFTGPSWVYGMTENERQLHLHEYRATRYAKALARRAALEQAVEIATAGGTSYMLSVAKLFDQKRLEAAQALSDAAKAAAGD